MSRFYGSLCNLLAENSLQIISIAALPDNDFQRIWTILHTTRFYPKKTIITLLKDLNSDEKFVSNDMLNSFVVNFDNFCKTQLRFDGRHKAEVTGACCGSCSLFQSS